MPRAKRAPVASPAQDIEDEAEVNEMEVDEGTQALQFDQPLTWRAGKPIPVADLLRRLQALAEELQSIDQEDAIRSSLIPTAQELASTLLLGHKDHGVKAYTLVCVVEMFRLLAPDAPYKGRELREIFNLFVSVAVPALASPDDPYYAQHLHVLSSLGTIKSICLLDGIPGSDNLILSLFSNCFDVLSGNVRGSAGEQVGKNVEYHMTSMLVTLVDECTMPSGAVDIVLAQFLRADPNALHQSHKKGEAKSVPILREVSPAYNMARAICNTCSDKMVRNVGQYFSSVLIDASEIAAVAKSSKALKGKGRKRTHDESEDEDDVSLLNAPSEGDMQEVEKAHRLLRELWRCCPDVIRSVMSQIEAEVSAENLQLRIMAVQTVGDMIAGIGAAGPPPPLTLEPAAYPSQSASNYIAPPEPENVVLKPNAPIAFSSAYPTVYKGFMDRQRDKSAPVRSAWVTEAGRILFTAGGGKGLDADQETNLQRGLADMLLDHDERVRLSAVQTIARFDFNAIVQKLGASGGVPETGSVLSNLAARIKDPKHSVRAASVELLARIWGVATGALAENDDAIAALVKDIPSRILQAWYVNDASLNVLIQRALHDAILPVGYPPIKSKATAVADPQRIPDSQSSEQRLPDPDRLRVERLLLLVKDLEDKAKKVFFAVQQLQPGKAKWFESAMKHSEAIESAPSKEAKKQIENLVNAMARFLPDPVLAVEHFTKFLDQADRRNFALVRFCFSPEKEYRVVVNAMKELAKRLEQAPAGISATVDTIIPFMRQASILVYNRSHVPAILDIARTDHNGLGLAAHEVLKEISTKAPDVFKVNIKELCDTLKGQAPAAGDTADWQIVESLKACAGFARRFPEGLSKDRDFFMAMVKFAKHGMPPTAAKQAITVIAASADRKEMYIKDIMKYCLKNFEFGAESFLSRLAALSQLRLVAGREVEDQSDAINGIAIGSVLGQVRTPASEDDPDWSPEIDDDLDAKLWALRIVVNGLRGYDMSAEGDEPSADLKDAGGPVFKLLNTLIAQEGELSKSTPTAKWHTARLRLAAAKHILKLCRSRVLDKLLTPRDFNRLVMIVQDQQFEVREGFNKALKKYLGQDKLSARFYSLVFIYAHEPNKVMRESTSTWLKSRANTFALAKLPVMEGAFSRFLSMLAHHQDFGDSAEDLAVFAGYIIFYLKSVASQSNLPQIYSLAQRVKTVQDGIDPAKSENLYVLSDLSETLIRAYQDLQNWSLQILPAKVKLPAGLFAPMPSHDVAQEISEKRFIPDEVAESLEGMLRNSMKSKKRKSDSKSDRAVKKAKASTAAAPKAKSEKPLKSTKKPKKTGDDTFGSSPQRRSTRKSIANKSYVEDDSSADDEEMKRWQGTSDFDANKENMDSSTPTMSDPSPTTALVEEEKAGITKKKKAASRRPPPPAAVPRARRTRNAIKERDVMDIPSDDSD